MSPKNPSLNKIILTVLELIDNKSEMPIDIEDIETVLQKTSNIFLAQGEAKGKNRATDALKNALKAPLTKTAALKNAKYVIISFTSGPKLTLIEFKSAMEALNEITNPKAKVHFGHTISNDIGPKVKVIVLGG